MRTMSRLLLLSLALLSACGGSGGPPPPPPPPPPPGDVAIDPTVASAAAANLSSLAASLAASSPQNAQAAQAAAALLASGTHATPVTIAASFRADPPAREALTAGQALAFGFQLTFQNPSGPVVSGVVVLQTVVSSGLTDVILVAGAAPGGTIPQGNPRSRGILQEGGNVVWAASAGTESATLTTTGATCSAPIPGATCNKATFANAGFDITASTPLSGGATGSRTAHLAPTVLVGVALTVDCALSTLCDSGTHNPPAGAYVLFAANDGVHGVQPWRTDGTPDGTFMLLVNGNGSSNPNGFVEFKNATYFSANDGSGFKLWRTDPDGGTVELVKDSHQAVSPASPGALTVVDLVNGGPTLFFAGQDSIVGRELWTWNGTDFNLVKDIDPAASSSPDLPYAFDNQLFFRANTVATGRELWRSDGTATNTVLVKDINPDAGTGLCNGAYAALNNELYFAAGDSHTGCELWKTDGQGNASLVDNIAADNPDGGGVSSNPFNFITAPLMGGQDALYFTANTATAGAKLYVTDGGTPSQVFGPGRNGPIPFYAGDMTLFNGVLYFDSSDLPGGGLLKTDGSFAGTVPVSPPANQPTVSNVSHIFVAPNLRNGQGLLLFQGVGSPAGGGSPMGGTELWASDGQQGGQTYLVLDINPGSGSSFPQQFRPVGTVVVFAATTDATGTELWVTDGTAAGTRLVKDILPGPGNGITTFF